MIKYEDECVGCPPEMGCMGDTCKYRNVKHLYCDKCHTDCEELFDVYGHQLCEDCLLDNFNKITLED